MPVDPPITPEPSSKLLLRVWLALGLQSFGGGSSLVLIHRTIVEQYGWISDETFTRNWALSQMCPGINLIAFTLLCGKQIAGVRGMVLCLLGLLLPSVSITILLTATYTYVRNAQIVTRALNAILPASVGLGLLSAYNMAREPIQTSRAAGSGSLALSLVVLIASGALMLFFKLPVFVILLGAGALLSLVALWKSRKGATP